MRNRWRTYDQFVLASPDVPEARPMTARSVLASMLLGVDPPRLPVHHLVAAGAMFGIAEGTVRVALSRMGTAGEVRVDDGWYELQGPLLDRQARQLRGRRPDVGDWDGSWELAVVGLDRRSADERADLRRSMRSLSLAEQREGVWLRPDNLPADRQPDARRTAEAQCRFFSAETVPHDGAAVLASELWDLPAWIRGAEVLQFELDKFNVRLSDGDESALGPGFVLMAQVLRHFLADPLLPDELLPKGWAGPGLREAYDRCNGAFITSWTEALRAEV
jgi:phenylacetic acid degradation operon negative regulatory protein